MHVPSRTARRCATLTATALLALTATTATAAPARAPSAGSLTAGR